jgi:LacI family gluconate utilization system Gnt-I transcriptional repressor
MGSLTGTMGQKTRTSRSAEPPKAKTSPKRVRLEDVAAAVGVSIATASRAFSKPEVVSPEIREMIRQASDRLGFRPSAVAGSLANFQSRIVGVIVPRLRTSIFPETLEAIDIALSRAGYQIMVGQHEHHMDREQAVVTAILDWSPAAIVLTGVNHLPDTVTKLKSLGRPVVEMWDLTDKPIDTVIGFSNREVGRCAARHLIEGGRRRLVFVVGANMSLDLRAGERCEGFMEVAREAGLPQPRVLALTERSTAAGGVQAIARLLDENRSEPRPDGIAFSTDLLALGGLHEAARRGIKVPDDIAFIGYGDTEFAPFANPPLTTIRPPRWEIGEEVGAHLAHRLSNPNVRGEIVDLGFKLVVRTSA